MRSRKRLLKYLKDFYDEMKSKRKNNPMRLQTDNEFEQVEIKYLNEKYKVTKVFAAEQKLQELKNRIPKIKAMLDKNKYKIPLTAIIKCSTENINNVVSEKYKLTPNKIEKMIS